MLFPVRGAVLLIITFVAFVLTDPYFTLIHDEVVIINAAHTPIADTLHGFISGAGQHEHPPLSDVLLHFWLPVAGSSPALLRLPSVLFFLAGLVVFAYSAKLMAGEKAFMATLWLGCLWPFAFHFGRLAGWYSFCFFLVALLTWTYLRYWDAPTRGRRAAFVLCGVLLVYSNYFGWAVIGCLFIDAWLRRRSQSLPFIGSAAAFLAAAYIPVWRAFVHEVVFGQSSEAGGSVAGTIVNGAAKLQSLFVSDAIAPWFWYFSVPVWLAIGTSLFVVARMRATAGRTFLIYFALLFVCMSLTGIIGTRRLLFVSGWLLLPFACALVELHNPARKVLTAGLMVLAGIGWTGVLTRKFYSGQDFLEPWPQVARQSANVLADGRSIVSNSVVFLFYLDQKIRGGLRNGAEVYSLDRWDDFQRSQPGRVLWVQGIDKTLDEETNAAEEWFHSNCVEVSVQKLVPDSGYALKARWFPSYGQRPFRVQLEEFSCNARETGD